MLPRPVSTATTVVLVTHDARHAAYADRTNAVSTWNSRHGWFWTGSAWVPPGPAAGAAPLWWGGIIVSLGIIAATFPLLAHIAGPEIARNE